jgi:hypothetical protein
MVPLWAPAVAHIPRGFFAYLSDKFQASKGAAPKLFTSVFIGGHTTEPWPVLVQSTLYVLFLRTPPPQFPISESPFSHCACSYTLTMEAGGHLTQNECCCYAGLHLGIVEGSRVSLCEGRCPAPPLRIFQFLESVCQATFRNANCYFLLALYCKRGLCSRTTTRNINHERYCLKRDISALKTC